jgi:hypothetical protein
MSTSDLVDQRDALSALLEYTDVLDAYTTHPWRATPLTSLSGEQMNALDAHFRQLSSALSRAIGALKQIQSRLGEDTPITLTWADHAQSRARLALTSPLPPRHWLDPSRTAQLSQTLQHGATLSAAYREAHQRLDTRYQEAVYGLNHSVVLTELSESPKLALSLIQVPADQNPRDTMLRERLAFDSHLSACVTLLPALAETARTSARLLGVAVPATVAEAHIVSDQASVVADSPVPPRDWLDADKYVEARIAALEAIERAEWAQQARASLETRYSVQFFTTDLTAISARFREHHTTVFRYVNPQYYLDCHTLRQLALPDVTIKQSELASDALLIAKVRDHEQWAQENRTQHARVFGRFYQSAQTDWLRMREM